MKNVIGQEEIVMEGVEYSTERRAHPRIEADVPIKCKQMYGDSYLDKCAWTKNLSKGGVNFTCDCFVNPARRLLVEISLTSDSKPVQAIVKVVWIRRRARADYYDIGCQFLAISKEGESALSDYIERSLNLNLQN